MREREGLIARIRQIRRVDAPSQKSSTAVAADEVARVDALEARMAYLEELLQGLQDSVHRESERHSKMIGELQAQIQPGAIGAALSRDARERGL